MLRYLEDDMLLSGLLADDALLIELLALNARSIGGAAAAAAGVTAGVFGDELLAPLLRNAVGSGILIYFQL